MTDFTLTRFRAIQAQNRAALVAERIPVLKPQIEALSREIEALHRKHKRANKADKDHIRDAYCELYRQLAPLEHEYATLLSYGAAVEPAGERVAIVGSRDYSDLDAVYRYVGTLPANTTVISGGAVGVDATAAGSARAHGLAVIEHLPDWKQYGKSAGFRRNADIVNDCDRLVAFQVAVSKGTQHSIDLARKAGKPVIVYTPDTKQGEAA